MTDGAIPYCGSPPVPGVTTWNADPVLGALLLVIAVLYGAGHRVRVRRATLATAATANSMRRESLAFASGWLILGGALLSPLCNLSVALFSARVGQHLILILIAAPLIALGKPDRALVALFTHRGIDSQGSARPALLPATLAFAAMLWFWHLPGPYAATFETDAVYWTMQASLAAAAVLLWRALFAAREDLALALLAAVATAMQMSLLGGLITFAPRALYAVHADTTWPWGLSTLADQQLGGLIMWVPGGLLFTTYALVNFAAALTRQAERR